MGWSVVRSEVVVGVGWEWVDVWEWDMRGVEWGVNVVRSSGIGIRMVWELGGSGWEWGGRWVKEG